MENFEFKILFELQNEEEMNLLEKCIVTEEFCNRKDTYNIMEGGSGGWNYVNYKSDCHIGSEKRKNANINGGRACQKKYKQQYGSFTKYYLEKMSPEKRKKLKEYHQTMYNKHLKIWNGVSFKGKHHTEQSKNKISNANKNKIPHNKGKITVIDINTGKKCYVDSLNNLPPNLKLKKDIKL